MRIIKHWFIVVMFIGLGVSIASGFVQRNGENVFIIDQTGKKWDVTQAASLGFAPEKFQYGIGKDAFTTLDDSHLRAKPQQFASNQRVIGVKAQKEAHAYSVQRLRYHEIANTHIAGEPIAAGF